MVEKTYKTEKGTIHYWTTEEISQERATLVLLPGLTADHRLFEKQIEAFEDAYNLFVWDAPGHAASWPFTLDFTLMDKARWLKEILDAEGMKHLIFVGQSMGGYVSQCFAQLYPGVMDGFVCIDSAPLQRDYVTGIEIWLLKRMEPVYRWYPWKSLLKLGSDGVATTEYGRKLMREMMMVYDGDQARYAKLCGHGYRMLAEAMEADLPYRMGCYTFLLCGDQDHAGSCKHYSRAWAKKTQYPLYWVQGAGHNSNTDDPDYVNRIIENMVEQVLG